MNRVHNIEVTLVVIAAILAVFLYIQFTLWVNQRVQQSCSELIQSQFRDLPAGCL